MAGCTLPDLRARYAEDMSASAGVRHRRVREAFAAVPREAFLTPPPWRIFSPGGMFEKVTSDPSDLYGDVLVVLDAAQGINNGQPSLHAAWLAAVDPKEGDTALHIGAGTGYYTALLARLVSPGGQVHAYEIDVRLAHIAGRNLSRIGEAVVHSGSGVGVDLPRADVVYVSAGAFAPDPSWLRALAPGGRLIFPFQPANGGAGYTLLVDRRRRGFGVESLMAVGFIPLVDTRERPDRWSADLQATQSAWLAAERSPDATATAVWTDVWFSSEEAA